MKNILKLASKILISIFFLAIQIIYFIWLFNCIDNTIFFINLLIEIISFILALYIFSNAIPLELKLSWIIFTIIFPIASIFMYLLFHISIAVSRLKKSLKKQELLFQREKENCKSILQEIKNSDMTLGQIKYLDKMGYSVYKNCLVSYYPHGKEAYQEMIKEINQAKKFIFLEFFIIEDGSFWDEMISILKVKAKQGVEIRILYDDIGSVLKLKRDYIKDLFKCGIKIFSFYPHIHLGTVVSDNRNHRKTLVVDGQVAFTGGINIAGECFRETSKYGLWKDSTVEIKGEAVKSFTKMFLMMWNSNLDSYKKFVSLKDSSYEKYLLNEKKYLEDGYVIPYGHNPFNGEGVASKVYLNIIQQSTKYLYIFTPYLILDRLFQINLVMAAKRGVEVRIITPGIPDKKLVHKMTRSNYRVLLESGVRIYEYSKGFLHAKCFLCDDAIATVGAVNLDYRSLYTDFENGCYFYHGEVIEKIKKDFLETIKDSQEILISDLSFNISNDIQDVLLKLIAPFF